MSDHYADSEKIVMEKIRATGDDDLLCGVDNLRIARDNCRLDNAKLRARIATLEAELSKSEAHSEALAREAASISWDDCCDGSIILDFESILTRARARLAEKD